MKLLQMLVAIYFHFCCCRNLYQFEQSSVHSVNIQLNCLKWFILRDFQNKKLFFFCFADKINKHYKFSIKLQQLTTIFFLSYLHPTSLLYDLKQKQKGL